MSENYSPNQSEWFPDLINTCDLNSLNGLCGLNDLKTSFFFKNLVNSYFYVPFIKLSIAGLFFLEYIDKNFTYFLYKFDTFQLEAVEAALGHLFSKIIGLD